jgi:predicted AAA+ superfamily ATPase
MIKIKFNFESFKNFKDRPEYLNYVKKFIDKPLIKVFIGMRRVGKSVIMKLVINELLNNGVPQSNILYINKESLEFDDIKNYIDLYNFTKIFFEDVKGKKYIFIDEIQEITEWEKAVASLLSENYGDIYISGSNAKLLSSELATLLSGRYIEIPIYPLTFREFLRFRNNPDDREDEFQKYLLYGGVPGIHFLSFEDEAVFGYLNSLINTILYKDVIGRYSIRDIKIFDRIVKYLFENIGNITTAKKIADYFRSQKMKVSVDTVLKYIDFIESSMILESVSRYDLKGKKILEFYDKIYVNDIGLRHGFIDYRDRDINRLLENIVYKEMQFRGYDLKVGVLENTEIDFVAERQNDKKYIQVCYSLANEDVVQREFGNLLKIKDNYEKIVISMDKFFPEDWEGIRHIYILDFLTKS